MWGVFTPGFLQTEPAWLTRPVWLIGLLRPSNTSNIFVKLFAQQCCVASWHCFLHILTPFCATNLLLLLFATSKFVMRRGGNTCNKQSQLAMQHCCEEGCTKMLPVILDLKRAMSQTGLLSHAGSVCGDPGINTPKHTVLFLRAMINMWLIKPWTLRIILECSLCHDRPIRREINANRARN